MSNTRRYLLYCGVPAALFYVLTLAEMSLAGFSFVEILRDPAQQTRQSSFLGFVSSIGAWLWVSAASISLFGAALPEMQAQARHRRLLLLCGALSSLLAVDDFFLIHDRFIAEGIMVPFYALFVLMLLKRHRAEIFSVGGFAFVGAGSFLAMSIVVDAVQEILPIPYDYSQALEEGFKFMGGATWLYFCFRAAAYRPAVLAGAPR